MERYKISVDNIKHNGTGKLRRESIRYPYIPLQSSDIYIISKVGDRTDLLAFEWYHDQRWWVIIAHENNLPGGTLRIPPGLRIRIPYPLPDYYLIELMQESQYL